MQAFVLNKALLIRNQAPHQTRFDPPSHKGDTSEGGWLVHINEKGGEGLDKNLIF